MLSYCKILSFDERREYTMPLLKFVLPKKLLGVSRMGYFVGHFNIEKCQ